MIIHFKNLIRATCVSILAMTILMAAAEPSSPKWEAKVQSYVASDKSNPPAQGAILFAGSSTIQQWTSLEKDFPKYQVINRGIGGTQIVDATYFANQIAIPYHPKTIIFYAGGNDIAAKKTPETVANDYKEFVKTVRAELPNVRIIWIEQNPSPSRWAQAPLQKQLNSLVREYVKTDKNQGFIDSWNDWLKPDGKPDPNLYLKDRLHHNEAGYKVLASQVQKYLESSSP